MTRILLIEDEETSREIAETALKRIGTMEIVFADDGYHALRLLDRMESPPDVVISDIFMPNKDGLELVNALAEREFVGGLILLTGAHPDMVDIAHTMAINSGLQVLAALRKPVDDQELARALASLGRQ
jgi:CheY-like chemotaxis protein